MSRDSFYLAVLAFLDQFIERGARSDITGLRQQLEEDDATRLRLEQHLPNDDPSAREGFDAMRAFLEAEWRAGGSRDGTGRGADLVSLLSWTQWAWGDPEAPDDEETADPAQWHDWLASIAVVESRRAG